MPKWKDPIVEEVRRVRKEIEKSFEKDHITYHREIESFIKKHGFRFSDRKVIVPMSKKLKPFATK